MQITLIVLVVGLVTVAGGVAESFNWDSSNRTSLGGALQSVLLVRELIRERRPTELENEARNVEPLNIFLINLSKIFLGQKEKYGVADVQNSSNNS